MKFRFPIVIIDEDFRSENTSGLGIRALADAIEKEGIAGKVSIDLSHDQPGSLRQSISVDLCAANDKDLAIASQFGSLLQ